MRKIGLNTETYKLIEEEKLFLINAMTSKLIKKIKKCLFE